MKPKMKRARNVEKEEKVDNISALPDVLLVCILSLLKTKEAVQTCILSKRWKDVWKSLPMLLLALNDQLQKVNGFTFTKFLSEFMFHRDDSISLHQIYMVHTGHVDFKTLGDFMVYAVSHHVKTFLFYANIPSEIRSGIVGFDPIFSCKSLKHLNISVYKYTQLIRLPEILDLPELETCYLRFVGFTSSNNDFAKPFSACKKLTLLSIEDSKLLNGKVLCVSGDKLSKLVIKFHRFISNPLMINIQIYAPNLTFFALVGPITPINSHQIFGHNLNSLQKLIFDVSYTKVSREVALTLMNWLKMASNVHSLKLGSNTDLKVLTAILSCTDDPVRFRNLTKVTIYCKPETIVPNGLLRRFLQCSPVLFKIKIIQGGGEELIPEPIE